MSVLDRADLAQCRALLANGSRTFLAGSRLLPSSVADAATVLYAFCRVADDAIDASPADAGTLASLRLRLDRIYRNAPEACPVDRAMAAVVQASQIDRTVLDALLEGFEWDIAGRRYQTLDDLYAYAARVAGTVGAMMALVMERRDPTVIARAVELGIAMQFSNIARDVGEDARMGRVYLPLEWFAAAGLDVNAWLLEPTFSPQIGTMVERLLREADVLYRRAKTGIGQLPLRCQPAIFAVAALYAEIGHEVKRRGFDSLASRAQVSGARKGSLCLAAFSRVLVPRQMSTAAPHPRAGFLSPAASPRAAEETRADKNPPLIPWYRIDQHGEALIELFMRLEQRDASARMASSLRPRA